MFPRGAWQRGSVKGREHFPEPAARTFPQKVGCAAQPSWVLLGLLPLSDVRHDGALKRGEKKQNAGLGSEMKTLCSSIAEESE